MDVLSDFFDRIHLQGHLFFAGRFEGTLQLDKPPGTAFIHVLEHGGIDLVRPGSPKIPVTEPSILLCPTTCQYKLQSTAPQGTEIVCASFAFGETMGQAFPLGFTETMIFPFSAIDNVAPAIATLLTEFHAQAAGRHKALNLLFEYVLILLIRKAVDQRMISGGVLLTLFDGKLGKVLCAMHDAPERDWSLAELAAIANMSRTKFSAYFNHMLGIPPIAYLSAWRIRLAQQMLKQHVQLKVIASTVGYSSQAAFTRAFVQNVGLPPSEWKKNTLNHRVKS